jgi:anaerobic ribonucleoside-triphosphate reductase activating protein
VASAQLVVLLMDNILIPVYNKGITLQEIPDKIAVFFEIGNCTCHCNGCHSQELWDTNPCSSSMDFPQILKYILKKYKQGANAILFMGGLRSKNLSPDVFIDNILKPLYRLHYNIGMYDGYNAYDYYLREASRYLTWIKEGEYISELGPLNSITTNQKFWEKIENCWEDKTKEYFQKGV